MGPAQRPQKHSEHCVICDMAATQHFSDGHLNNASCNPRCLRTPPPRRPPHVQDWEGRDALASPGRCLHPNNLIPMPKRRRVTELEPMKDPALSLSSGDDSGGVGAAEIEAGTSSGQE